jgi:soluble cytochrome b562
MDSKFSNPSIDSQLVPHLRYHLLADLPDGETDTLDLLLIEQMGTFYDLYETLVATLLDTIYSNKLKLNDKTYINLLQQLQRVEDPRLARIAVIKKIRTPHLTIGYRDCRLSDSIIEANNNSKLSNYRNFGKKGSDGYLNVWNHIYLGVWLALIGKQRRLVSNKPHKLPMLLGKALSEGNILRDVNSLIKLTINYHAVPVFTGMKEFLHLVTKQYPAFDSIWSPQKIGVHSSLIGIEDFPLNIDKQFLKQFPTSSTKSLWLCEDSKSELESLASSLLNALKQLEYEEFEKCINLLPSHISSSVAFPQRLFFTQMKFFALSNERKKRQVINLINETVPESNDIIDIVSFENELVNYDYCDFEDEYKVLSSPIALFVAWIKSDDSKLLSYLRISTKQAIKKLGIEKPSQIEFQSECYSRAQLIFFLNYICIPQIIDNIRAFRGTKAVLNERQNICRLLTELDPLNVEKYTEEIDNIDDDLLMEEGKRVVDRTRIYVDMDAHSRWMLRELKEDYERYKDLLDINITGEQNYNEIVDDFLKSDGATKTTFQPENEADAVLLSIIVKASNDFLTNSKYGLDYYLSKRIRHQSFIGLIRSHLEFSNLITTRVTEGEDFAYNYHWISKFTSLSQDKKDQLNALLSSFAGEFDDLLIHVRDNIFQLNTEDCPNGLIKIDFNVHVMSLLKHFILETDATFEEFVYYSNIFMWAFLQPSLEKTKTYIQSTLKLKIMHSADNLKAQARRLAGSDPAFDDFELQLTDKTASVQRSLEDVMSWFTPLTGVSADRVVISVDKALNLSTRAALDMLRPFEPKLNVEINNECDVKLHQHGLTFLNDTIFILLDNIKTHSGLKNPQVGLKISVCAVEQTITIECVNNTRQTDRIKLKKEIDKIKILIADGNIGDRAKLEGRSGFIKLAASIDKPIKGNLDFGLLASGAFRLSITNDLSIKSVPAEEIKVRDV